MGTLKTYNKFIAHRQLNIGTYCEYIHEGYIYINSGQRCQGFTSLWTNLQKSRYIESLILEYPTTSILWLAHEQNKECYDVLDGGNRSIALYEFYENILTLEGLEVATELEGKNIDNLREIDIAWIRRFLRTVLPIQVIDANYITIEDIINIYSRVNFSGCPNSIEDMVKLEAYYRQILNKPA
jgi:hypothetical protein